MRLDLGQLHHGPPAALRLVVTFKSLKPQMECVSYHLWAKETFPWYFEGRKGQGESPEGCSHPVSVCHRLGLSTDMGKGQVKADFPCRPGHWDGHSWAPRRKNGCQRRKSQQSPTLCNDVVPWPRPAARQLPWGNNFLLWSDPGWLPRASTRAL